MMQKVVTLSNQRKYILLDQKEKDGKKFYYADRLIDDITPAEDFCFFLEKIEEGKKSLILITDPDLKAKISLFFRV